LGYAAKKHADYDKHMKHTRRATLHLTLCLHLATLTKTLCWLRFFSFIAAVPQSTFNHTLSVLNYALP